MAPRLIEIAIRTAVEENGIEYDNPFDVAMTGLIKFTSGYKAIKRADVLPMLGNDFPYTQSYPEDARVIHVDIRGSHLRRRIPVGLGLVGDVKDTIDALLPLLTPKADRTHLAGRGEVLLNLVSTNVAHRILD